MSPPSGRKTPKFYEVDRCLIRGDEIKAFAEIKCRDNTSTHYEHYMVAAKKFYSMVRFSEDCGLPAYLVVRFLNGIHWLNATRLAPASLAFKGRTDRGDTADVEPVVMIPARSFNPLFKG